MLIHGFSKNSQVAKQLLDAGFYISFGKYLLLNTELEVVFESVPDNRFFLETDTVEEGIEAVYDLAAKYRGISVKEIQKLVSSNFLEVFNIEL